MTDAKKAGLLSPVAAIVKIVQDMDTLNEHTYADPNADDPYLRGYTNGIRLMHATLHGRAPDFVDVPDEELKRELLGPELPTTSEPDRSRAWVALEWLKTHAGTTEFERRLLVLLDILINDRR